MVERIRFVCEEGSQNRCIFRLDQSSGANLLIYCFAPEHFPQTVLPAQSIYLFAVSNFFVWLTDDKEDKNQDDDSNYDDEDDEEEADDNEKRRRCALLCVRIQIYAALLGKLKRGEGPFE